MTKGDVNSMLNSVSETILDTIRTIIGNNKEKGKPVAIDSIALMLNTNVREITPMIEYLAQKGDLVIHQPASVKSTRAASVTIVDKNK